MYYEDVPIAMLLKDVPISRGRGKKNKLERGGGGGGGGGGKTKEDEISTEALAGNVLHPHHPREFFTLGMEWGEGFYGPEVLHHSTDPRRGEGHQLFLHPVLRKYKLVRNNATANLRYEKFAVVHLAEDLAGVPCTLKPLECMQLTHSVRL